MIKDLFKVASKGTPNREKVIANWIGTNQFCEESQFVYELTHNSL